MTCIRRQGWKNWQIRWFIRHYGVDMSIAEQPDPFAYPDFNSFFIRALKAGARPVVAGPDDIAAPVDGVVSQIGNIVGGRIFQAKGHDYSLEQLLGGSKERAVSFTGGRFATFYLCPRDYHRVHMPLAGRLRDAVYVPGRLFSVNTHAVRVVPGLFTRNERLVTLFDTQAGHMAVILVGALLVAGIETVWAGVTRPRLSESRDYISDPANPVLLERGQEMGRFNMGSTVIVLFGAEQIDWSPLIKAGSHIQMGQLLGKLRVN